MKKYKTISALLIVLLLVLFFALTNRWQCTTMNLMPIQFLSEARFNESDNHQFAKDVQTAFDNDRIEFIHEVRTGERIPVGMRGFSKPFTFHGIMACSGNVMVISTTEGPNEQVVSFHYLGSNGRKSAETIRTDLNDLVSK